MRKTIGTWWNHLNPSFCTKMFSPQSAAAKTGSYWQFPELHVPDILPSPHSSPTVGQFLLVSHDWGTQYPLFPKYVGFSILLHWARLRGHSLEVSQCKSVFKSGSAWFDGVTEIKGENWCNYKLSFLNKSFEKKKILPQYAAAKTGLYSQVPEMHVPEILPSPHSSPIVGQSLLVRHDCGTQ